MSNNNFLLNYACLPNKTRGRYFKESEDENRSCFQRDRDRIIHSNAFRKLEYKTQVFINYEHDYYRTRLTHSLEVAQVARSIARRLGLNEDITECIALAHDLGHPPFGHAGEDALKKSVQDLNFHNRSLSKPIYDEKYLGEVQTSTAEYSNVFEEQRQASTTKLPSEIELRNRSNEGYEFDHNVQVIRILTHLEQKHANFDGMNLSWEVVEGVAKHNGPLLGKYAKFSTNNKLMLEYNEKYNLKFEEFSSGEAQVASIADDIAYSVHDLDDALRANLITINDLLDVPLIGTVFKDIKSRYAKLPQSKLIHESLSNIIGIMISDVVSQTEKNIKDYRIEDIEDIRKMDKPLVTFSLEIENATKEMKKFNMEKIYRHYKLNRTMNKAKRIIQELFQCFYENPDLLPTEWGKLAYGSQRSLIICDYISGMTDRFAIHEHRRIFDTSYEMTSF